MYKMFAIKALFLAAFAAQIFSACDGDSGTMKDRRDGKVYKVVKIGSQTWMAENLNYADTIAAPGLKARSWCFDNDPTNCDKYGRLYNWAGAIDAAGDFSTNAKGCGVHLLCKVITPVRGICPKGWHIPSKAEFEILIRTIGDGTTVGTKLKSTSDWSCNIFGCGNGLDFYGFSALPAGIRNHGSFENLGESASFWSSDEVDGDGAYGLSLYSDANGVNLGNFFKSVSRSIRCLKD